MNRRGAHALAETFPWAVLVAVGTVGVGVCSPATRAENEGAKSANAFDIRKAAAEAELIVIGGASFLPIRAVNILGQTSGPPVGYSLEVRQCLKGSYQHLGRDGKPFIRIADGTRGISTGTGVVLPPPTNGDTYIYFLRLLRAGVNWYPRELPFSLDQWFVPATRENTKSVREAIPLPTDWGEPSGGLQLGIRTTKPSYRVGDPIDIEVCIKNVSDRAIAIPQHRLAAEDYYPFTHFLGGTGIRLLPGGGVSFAPSELGRHVGLSKPFGIGQKDTLPPVSLGPGDVYIERIRLDSWAWCTSDGVSPWVSGTRWMLRGWFDTKDALVPFPGRQDLWKGAVASEFFELSIE